MGNVGPLEVLVVLIIALVIFGPKRIPELGRSVGEGIRNFKSGLDGEDEEEDAVEKRRLPAAADGGGERTAQSSASEPAGRDRG